MSSTDNNEQKPNKAGELAKNATKKAAKNTVKKAEYATKKAIKEAIKKAVMALIQAISWKVVVVILAVVAGIILLAAIIKYIDIDNPKQVKKITIDVFGVQNISDIINIEGNDNSGYYMEFTEDMDEKLEKIFEEEKSKFQAVGVEDISVLKKFMKAQMVTEFPYLGSDIDNEKDSNKFQGTIHIRRITPNRNIGAFNDGEVTETKTENTNINSRIYDLKYVKQDEFQRLIDTGDTKALEVFTLDENKMLNIATWEYSSNDGISIKKCETTLDYKSKLSKYSMPYEFLLTMLFQTKDKEFTEGLADLAIDSEYVIMVEDKVSINKEMKQFDGVIQQKEKSTGKIVKESKINQTTQTSIVEKASQAIEISYINCWYVKFSKEYSYSSEYIQSVSGNTGTKINTTIDAAGIVNKSVYSNTYTETEEVPDNGNQNLSTIKTNISYEFVNIKNVKVESKNVNYEYIMGNNIITGNEEKFVELYDKGDEVKNTYVPWLIEALEDTEETINMVDIVKYLFYKATDEDYGVVQYNYYSEFSNLSFNSYSGVYGGTIQEKIWFALKDLGYTDEVVAGAMGNIGYESSNFNPKEVYKSSGARGLAQWHGGRADKLMAYAQFKGVEWTDVDTQIEFLVAEISGQGPAAGHADQRKKGYVKDEGIVGTYDEWANAKDVESATLYFMRFFESNQKIGNYTNRLEIAKRILEEYRGREKSTVNYGTINLSEENKKKMIELLNHSVKIADDDSYRYVWGAERIWKTEPKTFDCSSFVWYLYKVHFGINIGTTSSAIHSNYTWTRNKQVVAETGLQAGDILWRNGHVGMYLGNGMVVEAKSESEGIKYNEYRPEKFTEAYRIIIE